MKPKTIIYIAVPVILVALYFIFTSHTSNNVEDKNNPTKPASPPYVWGTELIFTKTGNIRPYLQGGWAAPEDGHTWNNGAAASLKLPIADVTTNKIEMVCSALPLIMADKQLKQQQIVIRVNDTQIGEFVYTKRATQTMKLQFPKSILANSEFMTVSFSFPNAVVGSKVGIAGEGRMLAFAFYRMTFKEVN
jgi:hypothetical protein